jgi:hypothetical protein
MIGIFQPMNPVIVGPRLSEINEFQHRVAEQRLKTQMYV